MGREIECTEYVVTSSNGKCYTFTYLYLAKKYIMEQIKRELNLINQVTTTYKITEYKFMRIL